jgi:hypothetical protein
MVKAKVTDSGDNLNRISGFRNPRFALTPPTQEPLLDNYEVLAEMLS